MENAISCLKNKDSPILELITIKRTEKNKIENLFYLRIGDLINLLFKNLFKIIKSNELQNCKPTLKIKLYLYYQNKTNYIFNFIN